MTRRLPLALWLSLSSLSACEGVDGDEAGLLSRRTFVSSGGTFCVEWIAPPWEEVDVGARHLELRIRAEVFGASLDGSPPSHIFRMEHVEADRDIVDVLAGTDVELEELLDPGEGHEGEIDEDPEAQDVDDDVALQGVNLRAPRQVALAELHRLLDTGRTELNRELQAHVTHDGGEAVAYELVAQPGFFVRAYYFPSSKETVRAVFVSLFELDGPDIEAMVQTIETDATGVVGGL